jgi:hypothetical protein
MSSDEECPNMKMRNPEKQIFGTYPANQVEFERLKAIMREAISRQYDPSELLFLPCQANPSDRTIPIGPSKSIQSEFRRLIQADDYESCGLQLRDHLASLPSTSQSEEPNEAVPSKNIPRLVRGLAKFCLWRICVWMRQLLRNCLALLFHIYSAIGCCPLAIERQAAAIVQTCAIPGKPTQKDQTKS